MSGMLILLLALIMLPVFLLLMFMPYVTRKTESFGVSIPESVYSNSLLKQMRKTYSIRTGVLSGIAIIAFLILGFVGVMNNSLGLYLASLY